MTDMQDYISYLKSREQSPLSTLFQGLPFLNFSQNMGKYQQPAQNLIAAQTDINNPTYQGIYNQQKQQGQTNLAESIAELVRQNRKQAMMGRVPLFSNERGGEQLFRGLTRGYQDVQNQAANNTQGIIGEGIKNNMAMGQLQQQQAYGKAGFKSGLAGALAKLFGV